VGDYIYAKSDNTIWVNLFVGSNTAIGLKKGKVQVSQQTNYPWEGTVQITLSPQSKMKFPLYVRIPGWAQNQPVPGETYYYVDNNAERFTITVNGKNAPYKLENGYAILDRGWEKGDVVALNLPMPVRKVAAIEQIEENQNRVALQRGPLMYCVEHADNEGKAMNFIVPDDATFTAQFNKDLLNGVVTIKSDFSVLKPTPDGNAVQMEKQSITAIPYFSWANRGEGEMQLWLPRKVGDIKISTVK
jgi:DUF1680 family protein